jgi:predicted metal-dependent hydrolase
MYPEAYINYLAHFHGDRDYFECHEVLEEYWKNHPQHPQRKTWVGLIQVAAALYHQRRGNRNGALKLYSASLGNLDEDQLRKLGIEAGRFLLLIEQRRDGLAQNPGMPYSDIDIPIADAMLERLCSLRCAELGFGWMQPSDLGNRWLVDKHKLRDRAGVIEERERERNRRAAEAAANQNSSRIR